MSWYYCCVMFFVALVCLPQTILMEFCKERYLEHRKYTVVIHCASCHINNHRRESIGMCNNFLLLTLVQFSLSFTTFVHCVSVHFCVTNGQIVSTHSWCAYYWIAKPTITVANYCIICRFFLKAKFIVFTAHENIRFLFKKKEVIHPKNVQPGPKLF